MKKAAAMCGKWRILWCFAVMISSVLFISGTAMAYTDVPADAWYYAPVSELADKALISGYPDGTFRPNSSITRAEFSVIVSKALGLATSNASFSDTSGHWAQSYIGAVVAAGVMNGYPGNTFKPDNPITRAEIASTLVRAYVFGDSWGEVISFDDTWDHWAENNIKIANQNGIIGGYAGDIFRPDAQATRAETSAMISRAIYAFEPIDAESGESKISGDVKLTAQNRRYLSEIFVNENYTWTPPAGYQYLCIDITIENLGADAVSVNAYGFDLYLTNGQKIMLESGGYFEDVFEPRDLVTSTLETGTITFAVPVVGTPIAYVQYDYDGVKFPIKIK